MTFEGRSEVLALGQVLEQRGQRQGLATLDQHPHGQRAFGIGKRDLIRRQAQKAVVKARERDQRWGLPGQPLGPLEIARFQHNRQSLIDPGRDSTRRHTLHQCMGKLVGKDLL